MGTIQIDTILIVSVHPDTFLYGYKVADTYTHTALAL